LGKGAREEKQDNDLTSLTETDADEDAGDRLDFFTVIRGSRSKFCVERIVRGAPGAPARSRERDVGAHCTVQGKYCARASRTNLVARDVA
jgi:hypothetical protein